jgi:hypothetical protein
LKGATAIDVLVAAVTVNDKGNYLDKDELEKGSEIAKADLAANQVPVPPTLRHHPHPPKPPSVSPQTVQLRLQPSSARACSLSSQDRLWRCGRLRVRVRLWVSLTGGDGRHRAGRLRQLGRRSRCPWHGRA